VPTYKPGLFGAIRATVPVTREIFQAFMNDAAKFKVEIRLASGWMSVIPQFLCSAQE
jgi:hypothetical protein